jgi:hypothetical protein
LQTSFGLQTQPQVSGSRRIHWLPYCWAQISGPSQTQRPFSQCLPAGQQVAPQVRARGQHLPSVVIEPEQQRRALVDVRPVFLQQKPRRVLHAPEQHSRWFVQNLPV